LVGRFKPINDKEKQKRIKNAMALSAIAFVVIFGALVCFLISCRMNANKVEKKSGV
jgi:heme/copper-type cytochrome/quinol oxidase subunit 2